MCKNDIKINVCLSLLLTLKINYYPDLKYVEKRYTVGGIIPCYNDFGVNIFKIFKVLFTAITIIIVFISLQ